MIHFVYDFALLYKGSHLLTCNVSIEINNLFSNILDFTKQNFRSSFPTNTDNISTWKTQTRTNLIRKEKQFKSNENYSEKPFGFHKNLNFIQSSFPNKRRKHFHMNDPKENKFDQKKEKRIKNNNEKPSLCSWSRKVLSQPATFLRLPLLLL